MISRHIISSEDVLVVSEIRNPNQGKKGVSVLALAVVVQWSGSTRAERTSWTSSGSSGLTRCWVSWSQVTTAEPGKVFGKSLFLALRSLLWPLSPRAVSVCLSSLGALCC